MQKLNKGEERFIPSMGILIPGFCLCLVRWGVVYRVVSCVTCWVKISVCIYVIRRVGEHDLLYKLQAYRA